jgi:hypothetical protein
MPCINTGLILRDSKESPESKYYLVKQYRKDVMNWGMNALSLLSSDTIEIPNFDKVKSVETISDIESSPLF